MTGGRLLLGERDRRQALTLPWTFSSDLRAQDCDGMPRATREAGVADFVGSPDEIPAIVVSTPPTRSVVVVDSPDNRDMLPELLRYAGFECKTADDGVAGLALVQQAVPTSSSPTPAFPG